MQVVAIKKQEKLQDAIAEYQRKIDAASRDVAVLEGKRQVTKNELVVLDQERVAACRLEAIGKKNDRTSIDNEMGSKSAKIAGLDELIKDKRNEVIWLQAQREPLVAELSALDRAEQIERELAEVQQSFAAGEMEIRERNEVVENFNQRIARLRSGPHCDEAVKRAAMDVAYKLERMSAGAKP